MGFCKYCGTKNEEDAQFCERCGKSLIDQDKLESEPPSKSQKPLRPQNITNKSIDKKPSTVILVLGYLLAFLGGLFGIAIGIYLFTRKNSDAKFHGRNMIIIASILLIVGVASSAFLLSNFTPSFFGPVQDEDGSYTITRATIDLYIQEDGTLQVRETLYYSFSGTYNGIYRDIPLKTGERIENLQVSTKGAFSSYEVNDQQNMQRIMVLLYSNPQQTIPITNSDVEVTIEYEFINVITIYNDIAELQYKIWGEDWEVDVGEVTTNIYFQSDEGVKYWLNPPYLAKSSSWQSTVLNIVTTPIPAGNWFEIRAAIPLEQFSNPIFARRENMDGLPEMEWIQQI